MQTKIGTYGALTYLQTADSITITGYTGLPVSLQIPAEINGIAVLDIRENAFYQCSLLQHITIPDSITQLGHHCFYGCSSLTNIRIPDSVQQIGDGAFQHCTALKTAILPSDMQHIAQNLFYGCTALEKVDMPEALLTIGMGAFYGCNQLHAVALPGELQAIGQFALGYDNAASKIPQFTIYSTVGSVANHYANDNALAFRESSQQAESIAAVPLENDWADTTIGIFLPWVLLFVSAWLLLRLRRWRK